jgi:dCMP deaminase
MSEKPDWDDYFLGIVGEVSKRATCNRGKSGCVVVKNRRILATGYVGSPSGTPHCDDVGHELKQMIHQDGKVSNHCVRTIHAEQNAICQAARFGIKLEGATMYMTMTPCYTCAKMIINSGIKRVVAIRDYHASADTKAIFCAAGVEFELKENSVEEYPEQ